MALILLLVALLAACSKEKATDAPVDGTPAAGAGGTRKNRGEALDDRLFAAVKASDAKTVAALLAEGANPDALDAFGAYPLYNAAHDGSLDCVAALLDGGAKVDGKGLSAWTPLQEASAGGHDEVVRLLLARGARIDAVDPYGESALHDAANGGQASTVRILLEAGADPNLRDGSGQTALHKAAFWGRMDAARVLLKAGADAGVKDDMGFYPCDWAEDKGHYELARLLARVDGVKRLSEWLDDLRRSWSTRGIEGFKATRAAMKTHEAELSEDYSYDVPAMILGLAYKPPSEETERLAPELRRLAKYIEDHPGESAAQWAQLKDKTFAWEFGDSDIDERSLAVKVVALYELIAKGSDE